MLIVTAYVMLEVMHYSNLLILTVLSRAPAGNLCLMYVPT